MLRKVVTFRISSLLFLYLSSTRYFGEAALDASVAARRLRGANTS